MFNFRHDSAGFFFALSAGSNPQKMKMRIVGKSPHFFIEDTLPKTNIAPRNDGVQ